MNFKQRLRFFLIGFVPGCIILLFIVRKTGCESPNELKMKELQYQHLELGKKAKCKLNCLVLTPIGFKAKLHYFEVDYNLSDVHKKPYGTFYLRSINNQEPRYEMIVEDRDTTSYIHDIKLLTVTNCACDTIK